MISELLATTIVAVGLGRALARIQFTGVNIAGFDFGCGTDGSLTPYSCPSFV